MRRSFHERVFLVEDDPLVLLQFHELLTDLGCEVAGTASTVADGIAMAKAIECDLALLDVNLRGKRCYPIAEVLVRRGVPFAFVTGYSELNVPAHFAAAPILQKPFGEGTIADTLARLSPRKQASNPIPAGRRGRLLSI